MAPPATTVWQARFAQFGAEECTEDPLYVALCQAAATRPEWVALLGAAPPAQQKPNLWLAAIHDRVLALADGARRPPLAAYFPSAGGRRMPDAALVEEVDRFLRAESAALRESITRRTTQTNEIGRCAVLWPVLVDVAVRRGARRIALLDVGCSAGLNLGVDAWSCRLLDAQGRDSGAGWQRAGAAGAVAIECRVLGEAPMASGPAPEIVQREGIDLAPIDLHDDLHVRWLRACLWPHDLVRRVRLDAAVAVARHADWPLHAVTDATASVDDWLARVPDDVWPVVFNSWALYYFDRDARALHASRVGALAAAGRLAWVCAEAAEVMRGLWAGLPGPTPAALDAARAGGVSAGEFDSSTVWAVAEAGSRPGAGPAWRVAARSHGHGRWASFSG